MLCAYSSCAACTAVAVCGWCNGTCVFGACGETCPATRYADAVIQYVALVLFVLSLLPLCMLIYGIVLHCRARAAIAPVDSTEVVVTV
jgi:hypothetical protein